MSMLGKVLTRAFKTLITGTHTGQKALLLLDCLKRKAKYCWVLTKLTKMKKIGPMKGAYREN
jgi:hypothetical protein